MNGPDFQYDGLTAFAPITRAATPDKKGLMSAADKAKLDGFDATKIGLLVDPPRARITKSVSQSIPHAVQTAVVFDAATYHTGGALGGGIWNGTDTITIPRQGIWQFGALAQFPAATGGQPSRRALIQTGGGANITIMEVENDNLNSNVLVNPVGETLLNVGDTVKLYIYQTSGVALAVSALTLWCRYVCD